MKPLTSIAGIAVLISIAVSAQAQTPSSLGTQVKALQTQVATLQKSLAAVQAQITKIQSSSVMALAPFVSVDPNPQLNVAGPNITFSGANIHIVSGSGATDDHIGTFSGSDASGASINGATNGHGNLIIGYDEVPASNYSNARWGSHNLIVGRGHQFLGYGNWLPGKTTGHGAEGCFHAGGFNFTEQSTPLF